MFSRGPTGTFSKVALPLQRGIIIPIPSHTHQPILAPSDIRCYTYVVLTTRRIREEQTGRFIWMPHLNAHCVPQPIVSPDQSKQFRFPTLRNCQELSRNRIRNCFKKPSKRATSFDLYASLCYHAHKRDKLVERGIHNGLRQECIYSWSGLLCPRWRSCNV